MLTRLAPTPSGFLHKGNIYNILLNWLWARSNNGKVLLRIDDADTERKRPEYINDIFNVLHWLGLNWDIGPSNPADLEQNWSQVHRTPIYTALLSELTSKNLIFSCICSRKQLQTQSCSCINKQYSLHHPGAVWKIKKPATAAIPCRDKFLGTQILYLPGSANAYILKKKNGLPAYQVCSLADDRHFGVTHICRGKDLMESSAMQLYIDANLDTACLANCCFWHHPLLTTDTGTKLSKSAGNTAHSLINTISKAKLLEAFAAWAGIPNAKGITLNHLLQESLFTI
ncbi:MAG TPA: glutamate--tRNA ligase family protein [Ferruginibacter sp.]|nr:glutamate--tRNA ligase family protein [Ferruginibacter sp.]HMP21437.1 glutamate--tRNA ligase family protein [Ferruginibacter sp.]